jgi:acyl-CoA synthetase (AMP-forming)/AMP-acid ligase II
MRFALAERLTSLETDLAALSRFAPHALRVRRGGRENVARLLAENAERWPDRTALFFEDERYSWAELDAHANRWAHFFLARGVRPGDAVVLLMDNRPEYVFSLMGLGRIRAIAACLNTHVSGSPLAHAARIVNPRLAVVGSEHARERATLAEALGSREKVLLHRDRGAPEGDGSMDEELAAAPADTPGDGFRPRTEEPAAYLYTSGTTGLPKAAVVTNQRFLAASIGFGRVLHEATEEDVIYTALPLYHGSAQWGGLGASVATGAALALRRKFSASQFWSDAVRFGATRFVYIGELCRYLLHTQEVPEERLHRVRIGVGNGLRKDVWVAFQKRFGVPLLREFYGATEGNAPLANLEGRPGMVGRLRMGQALVEYDPETAGPKRDAKGRCIRVARAGETGLFIGRISLVARFDGYADSRATESKILRGVFRRGDAWFNSGDLLTLHEGGWVSFADRAGDTFRWKGENVSTNEVSELLNEAPGVLESNVYGVVVPGSEGRAGMASLRVSADFDLDSFAAHVEGRLPKYARPLFLRLQSDMRITSTFKHLKVDYRNEGYDPTKVSDPVFALLGGRYVRLDGETFARLARGEITPG